MTEELSLSQKLIEFLYSIGLPPMRILTGMIALLIIVSTRSINSLIWALLLIAIIGTTLGGWIGQLIVAAAGACLLIYVARMIRRKS